MDSKCQRAGIRKISPKKSLILTKQEQKFKSNPQKQGQQSRNTRDKKEPGPRGGRQDEEREEYTSKAERTGWRAEQKQNKQARKKGKDVD